MYDHSLWKYHDMNFICVYKNSFGFCDVDDASFYGVELKDSM